MNSITNITATKATLIGFLGLIIWSFSASVVANLSDLPIFQCLAFGLTISFLFCAIKFTIQNKWSSLKLNNKHWIVPAICFSGNLIFYTLSFKYAPPEQADLIIYLWPSLVIILSRFFIPQENIKFNHLLAVLIGIAGISALIMKKGGAEDLSWDSPFIPGYVFAFMCALCWSTYTIISRRNHSNTPSGMVGIYCGLGAPIAWALHLSLETVAIPSYSHCGYLLVYGVAILGIAYTCWDIGIKRGNFKLLTVIAYANPVLSVLLLVLFGKADLSPQLGAASILVAVSAVVARA